MSSGSILKFFKPKKTITVPKTSNSDHGESYVGSLPIKKQKLDESQSTANYNIKLVKTSLRSTLGQFCLESLLILSCEKDVNGTLKMLLTSLGRHQTY